MKDARHGALALLAACVGLGAVAGCAASTSSQTPSDVPAAHAPSSAAAPSASAAPTASLPAGVNAAAFDSLARQEASAWARSPLAVQWRTGLVIFVADDLSSGPSGGFPSVQDKEAFGNGNLVFTGPPPSGAPDGVVTWPDGSTMKVPVLSEAQTFSKLTDSKECPGCVTTPLDVTAAAPTTLAVETSRGLARVPAWAFTLQGVSAPVIQAALPADSYITPGSQGTPTREKLAPLGREFTGAISAAVSADGRTLTLTLGGSPCDTTWGGLDAETGGAVVIGGWMHNPTPDAACEAMLVARTTTVQLRTPLAGRVIIDASTGQPVRLGAAFPAPSPS